MFMQSLGRVGVAAGVALVAVVTGASSRTPTGEEIVRSMHDQYVGRWFRTLTFVQTTTLYRPTGDTVQTWYESMAVPGKLRIDIAPLSDGKGYLFRADSTYLVTHGAVTKAMGQGNALLMLAFDAYVQPVDTTLAEVRQQGIDLAKVHAGVWDGRAAWVVGADRGDTVATQIWIDRERLVVLRVRLKQRDVRFSNYLRVGGGWVAPSVDMFVNGVLVQHEQYASITPEPPLNTALFDPAQWTTAPHWAPKG
jgi:hypothetical protein